MKTEKEFPEKTIRTDLWMEDSVELFLRHYRVGDTSSHHSILVDASLNVLMYIENEEGWNNKITTLQGDFLYHNKGRVRKLKWNEKKEKFDTEFTTNIIKRGDIIF